MHVCNKWTIAESNMLRNMTKFLKNVEKYCPDYFHTYAKNNLHKPECRCMDSCRETEIEQRYNRLRIAAYGVPAVISGSIAAATLDIEAIPGAMSMGGIFFGLWGHLILANLKIDSRGFQNPHFCKIRGDTIAAIIKVGIESERISISEAESNIEKMRPDLGDKFERSDSDHTAYHFMGGDKKPQR